MCALCDWFQHAAVSPISDIVDEEVKKEVEEVVQDSLKRAPEMVEEKAPLKIIRTFMTVQLRNL